MASSHLYKEAHAKFVRACEERYRNSSHDLDTLRDFLAQNGSPEEAKAEAAALKAESGKKWGSRQVGDTEIPGAWIDKIMANIGNFVAVGNYAMTGAPESVGLAWFAVKLTLSAIKSNYDLYAFFGAGLTDISEIMIIIPHYDRLYDERDRTKTEWKPSPVVEGLFRHIIDAYVAVLTFSFSVKRHLSAGTVAKLKHGFKDFFGTSKVKFQDQIDKITAAKKKILEESQAVFQDKSIHQLESVQTIVSSIQSTVNDIKDFQSTLQRMQEQQTQQFELVLKKMEDIKATSKPKTAWDLALQDFEKNKEALKPQKDSDAWANAIDQRYPGTCEWVFDNELYSKWKQSSRRSLLCLTGQQGSGKSTVLATIVEQLGVVEETESKLLYFSCQSTGGAAGKTAPTADEVCHTLLFQLYQLARLDEDNVQLLQECNKVFANPKRGKKTANNMAQTKTDNSLPDFADAFVSIVERLKVGIIVVVDEADSLAHKDQLELAARLQDLLAPTGGAAADAHAEIKALVGCRLGGHFNNRIMAMESVTTAIVMGDCNHDDLEKKVSADLKKMPGLTQAEQDEAKRAILDKAGPRFDYINDIAIPFMREPFQRPLSKRLKSLPEGMGNIYNEALHKMGSNYVGLLRTALTWTMLGSVPLKVEEIRDAYHGTYSGRGPEALEEAKALVNPGFANASELDIEQLRDASGPFLRLEQESSSGEYFVSLQDPPQIREFCLRSDGEGLAESHAEGEICARCKEAMAESKTLSISKKQAHLEIALACLRNLNNPVFQRRAMGDAWLEPTKSTETEAAAGEQLQGAEEDNKKGSDAQAEAAKDEKKETEPGDNAKTATQSDKPDETEKKDQDGVGGEASDKDTEKEDGEEKRDGEKKDDNDSGYASDESQDDEDTGVIDFSPPKNTGDDDVPDDASNVREQRYELMHWHDHLRAAEDLWTAEERQASALWAEVIEELDHFANLNGDGNQAFFDWWQRLSYSARHWKPLHVAAFFGLTVWTRHLLDKGHDLDEMCRDDGYDKNSVQLAATAADRIDMLKLLMEYGADLNAAPGAEPWRPPFHGWMWNDSSYESVKLMLEHGADPTMKDKTDGWGALHYLAWRGSSVETLDLLLAHESKPDINTPDEYDGATPLHIVLWRREVPRPLLRALVDRGADVNWEDKWSYRPLQMACQWGDLEALKIICHSEQAITEIDDEDQDGGTALLEAARGNHVDCIRFLLGLGVNVNLANKRGRVALHELAQQGARESTELLLEHGAKLNVADKRGRTPLFSACNGKSGQEAALLLLDRLLAEKLPLAEINVVTKSKRTVLRQAASHGLDAVVEKLIEAAVDDKASLALDQQDTRKGMTALHRAAWLGHLRCVSQLLAAGADVSLRDKNDKTALVRAYESWGRASHQTAFEDILALLVDRDPPAALADAELVAICAVNGSARLLAQLCELGADLNRQDRYGWTPLELARNFGQAEAERFLEQQAAWAGMLPARWAADPHTSVSEDGRRVTHRGSRHMCLSADKPLPAGLDEFYFEVTLLPPPPPTGTRPHPDWPVVAIGFCTLGAGALQFPGWPPRADAPSARSWAYHGDDGGLYASSSSSNAVAVELPYQPGMTVGCGVDLKRRSLWFTRNGIRLAGGDAFADVQGRLFPVLGLKDAVALETNFKGPFVWKREVS